VRGAGTSITGRTALLHLAVHILPLKYEKTRKMADLLRIAHDCRDQLLAVFYFRQQSVLLGGPALCPANFLVTFTTNANVQNKRILFIYVKYSMSSSAFFFL